MGIRSNFSFRQHEQFGNLDVPAAADPRLVIIMKDKKFRKSLAKSARKLNVTFVSLDQVEQFRQDALMPIEAIILDYSACDPNNVAAAVRKLAELAPDVPITLTGPSKYAFQSLPPKAAGYVPRSLGSMAAVHLALSALLLDDAHEVTADEESYHNESQMSEARWHGFN